MRLVGVAVDQIGAYGSGGFLLEFFGHQNSPTKRLVARIGEHQVGPHNRLAVPGREHTEVAGQILDCHLGAELVEAELVGQAFRQRDGHIEQEAAAVARRAPR